MLFFVKTPGFVQNVWHALVDSEKTWIGVWSFPAWWGTGVAPYEHVLKAAACPLHEGIFLEQTSTYKVAPWLGNDG